jgi:pimeloyl-ACP methyl ester carboxylesterase
MRTFGRLLLAGLLLLIVLGAAFYERPLWVMRQGTHFRLLLSHVQSNYVMTPEGRVHYYEAEPRFAYEHGIPIVLVHGLGDRDESWAPMIRRLKRAGFHVYAPDLLGYGRSPKPGDSDYSISTQEQMIADFIQAIGLQKPDVGGWSMGGWIVMKLALDHPEMVDRVVVYDSAGVRYDSTLSADVFAPTDVPSMQRLAALLGAKPLPPFIARDALRKFADDEWVNGKSLQSMESGKDLLDDRIRQMQNPLLIVWGGEDKMLPLSVGEKLHAMDPKSELDIVEGCGHRAPDTCSGRVASATANFLKSNPVPEGSVRTIASMDR